MGRVGGDGGAPVSPQTISQAAAVAPAARAAAIDRGDARWRCGPQPASRDPVVQPHLGPFAGLSRQKRLWSADREPRAPARVRALSARWQVFRTRDRALGDRRREVSVAADRALWQWAAADPGA